MRAQCVFIQRISSGIGFLLSPRDRKLSILLLIPILPLAAGKEKEYFREGGSISIFQPLLSSYSRASIQDFDPFHVLAKDAVPDHPRRHDGRLFPFRDVPAGKIGHTTPKTDNALPCSKRVTAASGFKRQICAAVLGPAALRRQ
jgi:hypothetical protein